MAPKVLISCNLAPVGGCETHVVNLAPVLRRAGADVTIVAQAFQIGPEREAILRDAGVRIVASPFDWNSKHDRLRQLYTGVKSRVLLRREYDSLLGVGQGAFHLFLTQFVKRDGWSIYNETGSGLISRSAQLALAHMRAVIAMSPAVARTLRERYGRQDPISALPHLTNPGALGELPEDGPVGLRELRVGFFGGLAEGKRPDLLVNSWPLLRIGAARLDLHGGGQLEERIRTIVQEKGLGDRVAMHGAYRHEQLPELMPAKDFIVLPSLAEGLPQVLVEAMAHGVPFVATDVGGIADLAKGNPDVLVVPPGEAAVLAGVEEMARRVRSGQVSRRRLREFWRRNYSPEVVGAKWTMALLEPSRFFAESELPKAAGEAR